MIRGGFGEVVSANCKQTQLPETLALTSLNNVTMKMITLPIRHHINHLQTAAQVNGKIFLAVLHGINTDCLAIEK